MNMIVNITLTIIFITVVYYLADYFLQGVFFFLWDEIYDQVQLRALQIDVLGVLMLQLERCSVCVFVCVCWMCSLEFKQEIHQVTL